MSCTKPTGCATSAKAAWRMTWVLRVAYSALTPSPSPFEGEGKRNTFGIASPSPPPHSGEMRARESEGL